MIFHPQRIPGVFLIEPTPVADQRGIFRRTFCTREYEQHGLVPTIAQCNVSENHHAHTLRGFHYQRAPHGEDKTIVCLKGEIYDIVVDLRPDSPTYLQWLSFTLDAEARKSIHVPSGCANAFLTLQPNSMIHYYSSHHYVPGVEGGIRYNDPLFKFEWPFAPSQISAKDLAIPNYQPQGAR